MAEAAPETDDPSVTVVISRRVKPGREAEFEAFLTGVTAACMTFEGHLGSNIFRPVNSTDLEYRIIFKFDRRSNLQRWENSEERRQWFALAEELTQGSPHIQVLTGLETWFTLPGQTTLTPPPRHKMALVTWLAVFPLITCISTVLAPELSQMPLVLRTLTVTAIAIPTMTYLVMPRMTRLFAWWLYPSSTIEEPTEQATAEESMPTASIPLNLLQLQSEVELEPLE